MYKKIRPNHKITLIFFLIVLVLLEFLLWSICGTKPGSANTIPWWVNLIYTGCAILVTLIGFIIFVKLSYYTIDEKSITSHIGKSKTYYYFNIVYIDEEYSKKHIEVKFYYNDGYWVYLTDSKKKELIKLIKENSKLLTFDELNLKYPKAVETDEERNRHRK